MLRMSAASPPQIAFMASLLQQKSTLLVPA
jgi:hypothetical protein